MFITYVLLMKVVFFVNSALDSGVEAPTGKILKSVAVFLKNIDVSSFFEDSLEASLYMFLRIDCGLCVLS